MNTVADTVVETGTNYSGMKLNTTAASAAVNCSQQCRDAYNNSCNVFSFCGTTGGCLDGAAGTSPFGTCNLKVQVNFRERRLRINACCAAAEPGINFANICVNLRGLDVILQDAVWPVNAQQPTVTNIDRNNNHIPWTSGNAPYTSLAHGI